MFNKIKFFANKHPNITILIFSLLLGFITAMFANQSSSFIYPFFTTNAYVNDQNMFYYMGKLLVEGKTPYLDFYDHKGPYVFYYTALGVLLGGKAGMVIVQTIFFLIFYFFFIKTLKLYEINNKGIAVFSIIFALILILSGQSPSDFEINFPFMMIAIYFFIRAIKSNEDKYFLWGNLFNGIVAGISIHLRVTDAMVSLGMVLYYGIRQIYLKRFKNLSINALICVAGILLMSSIPFIHSLKGGFTSIMYEACITSNLKYTFSSNVDGMYKVLSISVIALLMILTALALFLLKKKKLISFDEFLFYVITFLVCYIVQLLIALYIHYLMILIPIILVFIARLCSPLFNKKYIPSISLGVASLGLVVAATIMPTLNYNSFYELDKTIDKYISSTISKSDRNGKTLCYMTSAAYYLNNDITVGYPDFSVQINNLNTSSYYSLEALKNYVLSDECKYIIIDNSYKGDVFVTWLNDESGMTKLTSLLEGAKYISIYSK